MYNFIDVNEASGEYVLPSEALKINGEYIENLIPGYRTLTVSGREALSPEVVSYRTGVRDGSKLQSKRYPERIIVVTYQLIAASNEAFRDAYNNLGKILDVEDAELIFNDEQDKFFVGTPCTIGEVEPGRNAVVGQIEILCTDPFKYSVVEYEATQNLAKESILIDYHGTYKAFPILEADFYSEKDVADDGETANTLTGNGDCGFVSFFNEDEKIIQLGDPDEVDNVGSYAKSQTLMNQTFLSGAAWGTTAKSLWTVNKGNVIPSDIKQLGTVAMVNRGDYYLTASNFGSASGAWHGPSITRQFGADAAGEVGAKNFTLTYRQKMCMSKATNAQKQLGSFQMQLADKNGNIVAGIRIAKSGVGKAGTMSFYVNGKWVNSTPIDLHYNNYYFGSNQKSVQTTTVTKTGNRITFAVGKYKRQYINDDVADMAVTQVTFMFEQYSTAPTLTCNGLYWAKFVKNNCATYKDVPNKFSADDVLEADCSSGEIFLNGVSSPELGALGNDWEDFYLTPGLNQIGFAYSSWVTDTYAPTLKVRYREVFL